MTEVNATPVTAPTVRVIDTLAHIDKAAWNALAGDQFVLQHEFLHALHETGCANTSTGWTPRYFTLWLGAELVGALPLYLKAHSYGEYVFDWGWAHAYERSGLRYYPKLLSAIPFTPIEGPRLLAADEVTRARLLAEALLLARREQVSSLHCLFLRVNEVATARDQGMLIRTGVQFHWMNSGYVRFDDFLRQLSHDKRKKIKQERRKARDYGLRFEWLDGHRASEADWRFFTHCYNQTYREHQSAPYLSLNFFLRIAASRPEHIFLVMVYDGDRRVASALNFRDGKRLYGRYWGSVVHLPGLHFEACYYQAIEFCIAEGIEVFEGGAQGEHKMARGFMPVKTFSAHWLAHPQFTRAVDDFLSREREGVERYVAELGERSPFRAATD